MEREQVKKVLRFCRDIDGEIEYSKNILKDYEEEYYTLSGGATNESFINSRNKVSRPTETLALNVPASASDEMGEMREQIKQLATLKTAILYELNRLPLQQKNILRDFYIAGLQWVQISVRLHYSEAQCKRLRNRGLDNLGENFQNNALVKNFNYPC